MEPKGYVVLLLLIIAPVVMIGVGLWLNTLWVFALGVLVAVVAFICLVSILSALNSDI